MIPIETSLLKKLKSSKDPVALFSFEDGLAGAGWLKPSVRNALSARAKEEGFSGKAGETVSFLGSDGHRERRFFIAGLGERGESGPEDLRKSAASLYRAVQDRCETLWVSPNAPVGAVAEGLLLASHVFPKYKKPGREPKLRSILLPAQGASERKRLDAAVRRASLSAEAVCFARDLVNEGPSDKTPERVVKLAEGMAGPGASVKVIGKEQAAQLGMGAFLGVARGAAQPPYLLHMVYKPKTGAKKRIGLVGKGVLFDSGGLSLKPAMGMVDMKSDMAGAAAVLGVFKVLSRLKVRAEVHAFAPLTYNMPGPDAMKPGDFVKAMNGKTIEVLNTDAEGRLILADALAYASRQKLDVIMDFATLTGAVVIALGSQVTAAMTNSKRALERVLAASKRSGELIWELPLPKVYHGCIKSRLADIQNIGTPPREAGSIIGGLFLQEFVDGRPWVHFDIAGTAWTSKGSALCPPGGTGAMVRTLIEYLTEL